MIALTDIDIDIYIYMNIKSRTNLTEMCLKQDMSN